MEAVPRHLWPRCARCQKPVERIDWWGDDYGHRTRYRVFCHGVEETFARDHRDAAAGGEIVGTVEVFNHVRLPSFHVVDEVAEVSQEAWDSLGNGGFLPVSSEGPPAPQTDALPDCATLRPIENPQKSAG